jgi:hypothetical protein
MNSSVIAKPSRWEFGNYELKHMVYHNTNYRQPKHRRNNTKDDSGYRSASQTITRDNSVQRNTKGNNDYVTVNSFLKSEMDDMSPIKKTQKES